MDNLTRAWATYLDVLAVEAPVTRAALRPARELDIDRAQRELRGPLLPELVTWFGLHGGTSSLNGSILPFCMPLDLPSAVADSVMIRDIWQQDLADHDLDLEDEEFRTAGSVVFTWLNEYLMIGVDGGGGGLFVDQRPGPDQGCVRWWDKVEADWSEDCAAVSLLQLITDLAAAVRDRTPIAGWFPEVVDGVLGWNVPD